MEIDKTRSAKKGKFIVIDGSDGSGKKTQSDLLTKSLKDLKHKVAYYDFPQYESSLFGRMVGRYLNGEFGEADEVSPFLSSILYAGDRFQASAGIKKDLAEGKIIISNRYTQSNMAFQSAKIKSKKKKGEFLVWLEELEYGVFNIPQPDLVIYLYVPYQVSQALVDKKSARNYTKLKRDIHEKNSDFLKRVEAEYVNLSKIYPEWRLIDCSSAEGILPIETIAGKVKVTVLKELESK